MIYNIFMEQAINQLLEKISDQPGWLAYLLLFLSAGLEYVFPPFPGDTVTLFAAFLIGARNWSFARVFLAINAGALLGALLDYWAGRWLGAPGRTWRQRGPRWEKLAAAVDRIAGGFERHGVLYL